MCKQTSEISLFKWLVVGSLSELTCVRLCALLFSVKANGLQSVEIKWVEELTI